MQHILLIEDNPADQTIIRYYLEESAMRHQLYVSESLTQGLDIVRSRPIDLVLLDLSVTDSMGFKTLSRFRAEAADLPVIVLTGYNNQVVGMQAVRAGAQDYLVKGEFDAKRLVNSIRFAVERFRSQVGLKRAAEELQQRERQHRDLQQLARVGHWEMDIVTNQMKWSDTLFEILGLRPQAFSPSRSDYFSYVHSDDRTQVEQYYNEVAREGKTLQLQHRVLLDGRQVKTLLLRSKLKFDEKANKVILLGSVQEIISQEQTVVPENEAAPPPVTEQPALPTTRPAAAASDAPGGPESVAYLLEQLAQTALDEQQKAWLQRLRAAIERQAPTLIYGASPAADRVPPAATGEGSPTARADLQAEEPPARLRVLLVEDHPLQRIALRNLLRIWSEQVSVTLAGEGEEAAKLLTTAAFDIVLLDLQIDAAEQQQLVRELYRKSGIPILVFLAEQQHPPDPPDRIAAGSVDYLAKPVEPRELYQAILRLLREQRHPAAG